MNPPRLALVSRGDPLTPYLFDALATRFPIAGQISPELRAHQRARVAAATFRPTRTAWAERFIKSTHGYRLRTGNTRRALHGLGSDYDLALQVHALAGVPYRPYVLYVDCTHRQSAREWPRWNPLSGRALQRWYDDEESAYGEAEHIFSFSRSTTRTLVEEYRVPADRVTTTGAGVNLRGRPGPARPPADPVFLFVGHDFERKGGLLLLRAFAQVRRAHPRARLLLVGQPPRLTAPPGVHILGRVDDRRRLSEIYSQATAFVLPSLFEPYGLVLLEAMASGLPIVASDSCGIPDIVDDRVTGRLVGVGDVGALTEALLELAQDLDLAAALGAAGQQKAMNQMQWIHVVERMAPGLYAAGRRTSPALGTRPQAAG